MGGRVHIVGGGLFGCFAAIAAAEAGYEVHVYDDRLISNRLAGSTPAACLIKPGWIAGLGDIGKIGLAQLEYWFGDLRQIEFTIAPIGRKETVLQVPPAWIRERAEEVAAWHSKKVDVISGRNGPGVVVDCAFQSEFGDVILVAAGVWCQNLSCFGLGFPDVRRLCGAAFTFNGVTEPKIKVWSPYKQIVSFSRDPGTTWVGDGSTILEENWTQQRQDESLSRCREYAPVVGTEQHLINTQIGLRPYLPRYPKGYLKKVNPHLWVSTGGAKNGTVIGAYQAREFVDQLKRVKA